MFTDKTTKTEFKNAVAASGSHFFDARAMQFFNSRLETGPFPSSETVGYFVTSEAYEDPFTHVLEPREYRIRQYEIDVNGRINIEYVDTYPSPLKAVERISELIEEDNQ